MTLSMIFSRRLQIVAALFGLAIAAAPPALADLVVSVSSAAVNPGTANDVLDVTLLNTGNSAVTVLAFSFGLSVNSPDITFSEATISTGTPYIFAGHSLFGPDIGSAAGQSLTASDLFDIAGSGAVVGAGGSVGLGQVLFDVAANAASGVFAVSLSAPETSLADPTTANLPIQSLVDGQISIAAQPSVPEPSAVFGITISLAALAMRLRRTRRHENLPGEPVP